MIPVTVSGTSIIVLRTATSQWASAPAFPAQVRNNVLAGIVPRPGGIVTWYQSGCWPGGPVDRAHGPLTTMAGVG
jgi:hypothetical protein